MATMTLPQLRQAWAALGERPCGAGTIDTGAVRRQLGVHAAMATGAREWTYLRDRCVCKVGVRGDIAHVTFTLNPLDLYDVQVVRVSRSHTVTVVAEAFSVHAEDLGATVVRLWEHEVEH